MKEFTLSRNEKLKSRKRIEALFASGSSFHIFPLRVLYLFGSEGEEALQYGVSVPSRNFKKAVHRNRVKRLMREAWRLQKGELQRLLMDNKTSLAVFFVYTGKDLPEYAAIREKADLAITRLISLTHEKVAPNS